MSAVILIVIILIALGVRKRVIEFIETDAQKHRHNSNTKSDKHQEKRSDKFTQVAQEAMQKDLAALPKVEADAMDKFKATGGSIVQMKDLQNFIARSPDMIQIWVDKSTKDGLGEKIKELIPLQRKAAQSFANSRN